MDFASAGITAMFFIATATAGLLCARRVNLYLRPAKTAPKVITLAAVAAIVASSVLILDALIFRSSLPPDYIAFIGENPAGVRMIYFAVHALNEDVLYRLFLMSAITLGLAVFFRNPAGDIPDGVYWFAIISAQIALVLVNVIAPNSTSSITPAFAIYALARFVAPGVIWGFLYWRYGFLTAQLTHIGTHLFLQPMLGYAIA